MRDSSLYLRSVQNDSNVISNVGERSHIICSLGGRCFAVLSMDKQLAGDSSRQSLSERHRAHKGIYPISKRFFLPAVVGMTIMSFRAYARNLHIINGRGFLAFPYRRSWNFHNILYDAERWLLRHGIKQKAIHIE